MLVDYSSSESSEDDALPVPSVPERAGHRLLQSPSLKVVHANAFRTGESKRIRLPSAADLLKPLPVSNVDDPVLHGGRKRTFAHERGNWASYCYFRLTTGRLIAELRSAIQDCCEAEGITVSLESIDEVHLSLTKTFVLPHHWIELFIQSMRESVSQLRSRQSHQVKLDVIKIFENEDRTRTFISLGVSDKDYSFLNGIVKSMDDCLAEFKLPPFYEPPDYHASFIWCLGSRGDELKEISGKFNSLLKIVASHQESIENDELKLPCENVHCKVGNKLYTINLIQ